MVVINLRLTSQQYDMLAAVLCSNSENMSAAIKLINQCNIPDDSGMLDHIRDVAEEATYLYNNFLNSKTKEST